MFFFPQIQAEIIYMQGHNKDIVSKVLCPLAYEECYALLSEIYAVFAPKKWLVS